MSFMLDNSCFTVAFEYFITRLQLLQSICHTNTPDSCLELLGYPQAQYASHEKASEH